MKRPLTLCAVALLAAAAAAPAGAASDALEGTWVEVSVVFNGSQSTSDKLVGNRTTFTGSRYLHLYRNEFAEEGTFEENRAVSPRTIDFHIEKGPNPGQTQLGIYKLEGDTLTLCVSHPDDANRPPDFSAPAGSLRGLVVLKRQQP